MMRPSALLLPGLALVCACAGSTSPATTPAPSESGVITPEMRRAAAVADSVRHAFTAADVAFMSGMIGHHAQAIVMAKWAPSHEAGPEVRVLTARIINAQRDEIATMVGWLREHGAPVPPIDTVNAHHEMHGDHHAMMPGMLSNAQMDSLDVARGAEFDRRFLRFMIQHHQGAVTMVDELFAAHGAGQEDRTFKIASDIYADQTTEIARMQKMLFLMLPGAPEP